MFYNAVKILEMKYEEKMEKLKDKMREKGERAHLSGSALIVYGRKDIMVSLVELDMVI